MNDISNIHEEWMLTCNQKGRVNTLSRSLMNSCGFAEGDIPDLTASETIQRCFGHALWEDNDLAGVLKKGKYFSGRYELKGAGGNRKIIQMTFMPLSGESKDTSSFIFSFRDITEQCSIEEILERYAQGLTVLHEISAAFLSEAGMSNIMMNVLGMIKSYYEADVVQVLVPAVNDESGTYELLAAQGSDAITGQKVALSGDSIEGNCVVRQCPVVVTDLGSGGEVSRAELMDDISVGSGIGVPMLAGDRTHGVLSILYLGTRQIDTAELWYLNVLSNILSVFIEKQRSLAKLTESERFMHSVLEGIGEGVVVVSPQMIILSANCGYLDLVGLERGDVIGKSYYNVSLGEEGPGEDEDSGVVQRVLETGRPVSSLNSYMVGKGRALTLQTKSYPIFGSAGDVIAVVETLMDITASLRLEKDLEKRVKELEEFYDMAVGRELRMIELKEEIERLREELSKKDPQ